MPGCAAAGTRAGPEEAPRYANGAEIASSTGQEVRSSRPRDRIVVADHSDALGAMTAIFQRDPASISDQVLKRWNLALNRRTAAAMEVLWEP